MSDVKALCQAVWSQDRWMRQFTRREYPAAFKQYQEAYGPLYAQAVRECEEDLTRLEKLADDLLEELEAGWKRQRFWNRSAIRTDERQAIIVYLSPMLLEESDPMCGRLAGMLRQRWADRWPKDEYHLTTYELLRDGFRNSIFGFDLAGKHLNPDKDRK